MKHYKVDYKIKIRICRGCKKAFRSIRKSHRLCSDDCFWKTPKGEALRKIIAVRYKEEKRIAAKIRLHTEHGEKYSRGMRSRHEMYDTLAQVKVRYSKKVNISFLYLLLKRKVNSSPKKFLSEFGKPDAHNTRVEFKIGRDTLRPTQLIYNILDNERAKVRWFPSWDSLELMLEGKGKDESLMFDSYLLYLQWCEEQMFETLKRNPHYKKEIK